MPLSTILLDVDHFKSFNDTYGHDMGDEVLRVVAAELNRNVRSSEVACRYGGEEFLIVAPGTGLEDACVVAERLRRRIETTEVRMGNQVVSVTASFGVASWPVTHTGSPESLISASDEALYHAKEVGRNRVCFHHPSGVDIYHGSEDHSTLEEISSRASS
ncbi:GGDEF domain-containing protein [Persicimonas caeni]|uniref:GGDEF domain-containing protein n=1 Tax=Persicimonas caeni TaxID=2292766 RepID=A0A4Y6PTX2_PERCE|nr:GGDEF domain-containing protein [Persicimonas caeni]QDG51569.1 GGDEF domain-containing protein [Persicimonas caeni]QED32790.1 GGDEF domain-containing protein [Persicimonas caeni]